MSIEYIYVFIHLQAHTYTRSNAFDPIIHNWPDGWNSQFLAYCSSSSHVSNSELNSTKKIDDDNNNKTPKPHHCDEPHLRYLYTCIQHHQMCVRWIFAKIKKKNNEQHLSCHIKYYSNTERYNRFDGMTDWSANSIVFLLLLLWREREREKSEKKMPWNLCRSIFPSILTNLQCC